jgi:hypothetical protein
LGFGKVQDNQSFAGKVPQGFIELGFSDFGFARGQRNAAKYDLIP